MAFSKILFVNWVVQASCLHGQARCLSHHFDMPLLCRPASYTSNISIFRSRADVISLRSNVNDGALHLSAQSRKSASYAQILACLDSCNTLIWFGSDK